MFALCSPAPLFLMLPFLMAAAAQSPTCRAAVAMVPLGVIGIVSVLLLCAIGCSDSRRFSPSSALVGTTDR